MTKKGNKQVHHGNKSVTNSILTYIETHPGIHFNDLLRGLKLAQGTLQYHLNRMEQNEKIIVKRKEYYTQYFPLSMWDPLDQKIIVLLRQPITRNLLMILLKDREKTGQQLLKLLKITKSTLSYYIKRLEKYGVIITIVSGRERIYSINQPERIKKLLKEYKKSFGDEMVERFVDVWVRI